ncbi:DUF4304 domain-containing protein [Mumia zhuanghuii]|uniref:DUF4304 domain-containing protein n=1 Tax=Mumia zhuanghuii TaxID=2585211 RepID=UPI00363436C5
MVRATCADRWRASPCAGDRPNRLEGCPSRPCWPRRPQPRLQQVISHLAQVFEHRRWQSENLGPSMPKSISESLGLYRDRLHPSGTQEGTDGWWEITDENSANEAVTDMISQLDRAGWPVLERMFSREAMMARLHDGDLGMMKRSNLGVFFARAEALMLMDAGPSHALDSRLDDALTNGTPTQRDHAERFDTWVRAEAAKA